MISMTPGHLATCTQRRANEGEPLISRARVLLITSGCFNLTQIVAFDNDAGLQQSMGMIDNVQRYHLNAFLNLQYLSVPQDTSYERSMIASGAPVEQWLLLLKEFHIPSLRDLQLPRFI